MLKVRKSVSSRNFQARYTLNQREYLIVQVIGIVSPTEYNKCRRKYMKGDASKFRMTKHIQDKSNINIHTTPWMIEWPMMG
jgi:hypothetical protein